MAINENQKQGNKEGNNESDFSKFRRKVRSSEVLSAALEHLLEAIKFTGRVTVVLQNGQVLKCGYEEGYFRHRNEEQT